MAQHMSHKHSVSSQHGGSGDQSTSSGTTTGNIRNKLLSKIHGSRSGPNHDSTANTGNASGHLQGNSSGAASVDMLDGKARVAAKLVAAMPTTGSATKIIMAFIQVTDYEGLDKYLSKSGLNKELLNLPLQKACIISDAKAVRILCQHGADVKYADQFGTTMLHFAMRGGGNPEVIMGLIEHNAVYEDYNKDGLYLVHWACQQDHLELVELLVAKNAQCLDKPDESGRLSIHIAASNGRPRVLQYLIEALSNQLTVSQVCPSFRSLLWDTSPDSCSTSERQKVRICAAANYMDMQGWTPLHHANSEEATNDYSSCIQLLLDNGADLMQQTPQGKTALDLAYGAGRSKVLIDILPTEQMLTLLQRIDDVVPRWVRQRLLENGPGGAANSQFADIVGGLERKLSKTDPPPAFSTPLSMSSPAKKSPNTLSPTDNNTSGTKFKLHSNFSVIRRALGPPGSKSRSSTDVSHNEICPWDTTKKEDQANSPESMQMLTLWRKILLNDDVELLDTLRDSMIWRNNQQETGISTYNKGSSGPNPPSVVPVGASQQQMRRKSSMRNAKNVDDFESAQGISCIQMTELFQDCYENGIGVYSHIQASYGQIIKQRGLRLLLRHLTGMVSFKHLTTVEGVIIFRPTYMTILFLAVLCGRFRIAECLLRMRQFDIIPACIVIALIIRRIYDDPNFPEQVRSELEIFSNVAEGIAVDVLSQVYLKDNTLKKGICRDFLNVPLRSFGDISLIDLCATAKCTALLSLPCCQGVLDQRWNGVLSVLPGGVRFISRFCPIVGLVHLEKQARKERTKALLECIAASANLHYNMATTSSLGNRRAVDQQAQAASETVGNNTAPSNNNNPGSNQSSPRKTTVLGLHTHHHPGEAAIAAQEAGLLFNKTQPLKFLRRPITIYDEMREQYCWDGSPRLNFVLSIYHSPSVKFLFHSLVHITFLCIFSYVLVCDLNLSVSSLETISLMYVLGYMLEEARQFSVQLLREGTAEYFRDMWNWIDLLAIICTGIGFIIRISTPALADEPPSPLGDKELEYQRMAKEIDHTFVQRLLYVCGLTFFYMRTLYMTSIWPIIGPRLKMMADMLKKDLLPLLVVFLIFISSFGVAFQSLNYPNNRGYKNESSAVPLDTQQSISDLFSNAFYSIFEVSVMLETKEYRDKSGESLPFYPNGFRWVKMGFLVIYTGIVNVILINLLIALFSNTVSRIDQRSTAHWLADRYQMVMEYHDRSVLPPPLNIFSILYEIFLMMYRKYCSPPGHQEYSNGMLVKQPELIAEDMSTDEESEKEEQDDFMQREISFVGGSHGLNAKGLNAGGKQQQDKSSKNKKNKKKRQQEKFQTINDRRWFEGAKLREADICLRFILVQSFSLKDKRHTLGYMSSASTLLPSNSLSSTGGGTATGGGERSNQMAMSNGAAGGPAGSQQLTQQMTMQMQNLAERLAQIESKMDKFMDKAESWWEYQSPRNRPLSPQRRQLFEANAGSPIFKLPSRSSSRERGGPYGLPDYATFSSLSHNNSSGGDRFTSRLRPTLGVISSPTNPIGDGNTFHKKE